LLLQYVVGFVFFSHFNFAIGAISHRRTIAYLQPYIATKRASLAFNPYLTHKKQQEVDRG